MELFYQSVYGKSKIRRKTMKNGSYFVLFLSLTFTLFGCATGGTAKNIRNNYDIEKEPYKSIIIGKVDIKQEGTIGIITSRSIVIKKAASDEEIPSPRVGEYFFISLDEGEYVIESSWIGFGALGAMGYGYPAQVYVKFRAKPGEVVYIGNLTVTYRFSGTGMVGRDILVSDQYEAAINAFRKKYPKIQADV